MYHYAQADHAFAVERADGSDSRLVAQGIMTDKDIFLGALWSPSHEWLAGAHGTYIGPSYPWIMNRQGTKQVKIPGGFTTDNDFVLEWSPKQDLIAVGGG